MMFFKSHHAPFLLPSPLPHLNNKDSDPLPCATHLEDGMERFKWVAHHPLTVQTVYQMIDTCTKQKRTWNKRMWRRLKWVLRDQRTVMYYWYLSKKWQDSWREKWDWCASCITHLQLARVLHRYWCAWCITHYQSRVRITRTKSVVSQSVDETTHTKSVDYTTHTSWNQQQITALRKMGWVASSEYMSGVKCVLGVASSESCVT